MAMLTRISIPELGPDENALKMKTIAVRRMKQRVSPPPSQPSYKPPPRMYAPVEGFLPAVGEEGEDDESSAHGGGGGGGRNVAARLSSSGGHNETAKSRFSKDSGISGSSSSPLRTSQAEEIVSPLGNLSPSEGWSDDLQQPPPALDNTDKSKEVGASSEKIDKKVNASNRGAGRALEADFRNFSKAARDARTSPPPAPLPSQTIQAAKASEVGRLQPVSEASENLSSSSPSKKSASPPKLPAPNFDHLLQNLASLTQPLVSPPPSSSGRRSPTSSEASSSRLQLSQRLSNSRSSGAVAGSEARLTPNAAVSVHDSVQHLEAPQAVQEETVLAAKDGGKLGGSGGSGGSNPTSKMTSAAPSVSRSASKDVVVVAPRASRDSVGTRREKGAGGSLGGASTDDVLRQHHAASQHAALMQQRSSRDSVGSRGRSGNGGGGGGSTPSTSSSQPTLLQSAYVRSRLSLSASASRDRTLPPTMDASSSNNPLANHRDWSRESVSAPGAASRLHTQAQHSRNPLYTSGSRDDVGGGGHDKRQPESLYPGARGSRDSIRQQPPTASATAHATEKSRQHLGSGPMSSFETVVTTPKTWHPGRPPAIQNNDDDDLAKLAKGLGQDTPQTPLYNPADDRDERSTIDEFFFTHDDQFGEDDAPLGEGIVTESATAAAAAGAALTGSQQRQDDDTHHLLSRGSHRNSSGNGKSGSSSGGGGGHRGSPPLGGAWGRPARKWEPNLGFPAFAPDNGSYGGGGGGTGEKRVTSPIGSSSSDKYLSRPRSPLDAGVDKAWEMRSGSRSPSPRRPPAAATSSPPGSPNSSQNLTGMTTTMTSRSSPNTGISARTRGSYSSSDLNHHSKDRHYHSQNYGTRFTARRSLSSALEAKSSSRYRTSSSDTGGDYNNNSSSSRDSRLAARRRNLARRQRSKPSEQESSPRRAVALADADEPVTAEDMAVALEDYRVETAVLATGTTVALAPFVFAAACNPVGIAALVSMGGASVYAATHANSDFAAKHPRVSQAMGATKAWMGRMGTRVKQWEQNHQVRQRSKAAASAAAKRAQSTAHKVVARVRDTGHSVEQTARSSAPHVASGLRKGVQGVAVGGATVVGAAVVGSALAAKKATEVAVSFDQKHEVSKQVVQGTADAGIQAMAFVVDRPNENFLRSQKGWCHLELEGTNLFLDVSGQRMRRGAGLVVWPKTRGYNQIWRHDNPTGVLQSRLSGLVMDVDHSLDEAGARVITWSATGRNNQQFEVVPADQGCVRLLARNRNTSGKALAVGVVVMADSDNEQQPAATATEEDDEHGFKSSGGKGYVEPGSNVVMVSLDDEEQTTNQFTYSKWRLVPMREKTADNVTSL